jgi:hypothetical protein
MLQLCHRHTPMATDMDYLDSWTAADQQPAPTLQVRKNGTVKWLRPDGKTQVTVEYRKEGGAVIPLRVHTILISTQHDEDVTNDQIHKEHVIKPVRSRGPSKTNAVPPGGMEIRPCSNLPGVCCGGPAVKDLGSCTGLTVVPRRVPLSILIRLGRERVSTITRFVSRVHPFQDEAFVGSHAGLPPEQAGGAGSSGPRAAFGGKPATVPSNALPRRRHPINDPTVVPTRCRPSLLNVTDRGIRLGLSCARGGARGVWKRLSDSDVSQAACSAGQACSLTP